MSKTKQVQVFLVGDHSAEISGILVKEHREKDWYHLTFKDDAEGHEVFKSSIPLAQVRMVRYYDW